MKWKYKSPYKPMWQKQTDNKKKKKEEKNTLLGTWSNVHQITEAEDKTNTAITLTFHLFQKFNWNQFMYISRDSDFDFWQPARDAPKRHTIKNSFVGVIFWCVLTQILNEIRTITRKYSSNMKKIRKTTLWLRQMNTIAITTRCCQPVRLQSTQVLLPTLRLPVYIKIESHISY